MVVDHAGCLHEGVDDGGADELEAARGKLLRYLDRNRRGCRHARGGLELVDLRLAASEVPQQFREAGPFLHNVEIGFCAGDRAFDLGAVAYDADIVHQRVNLLGVVTRDLLRPEIVEGFAKVVALAQDGDPRQASLESVEDQLFIQRAVVIFRHAPFGVVIGDVERVFARPGAARLAVGMQFRGAAHATVCFGEGRSSAGSAMRMGRPPAVSLTPASSASDTRSVRISASPCLPAVEPMVPTCLSPARIGWPGSGEKSSRMIFTVRVRAVPRCCIRDTTSWPT